MGLVTHAQLLANQQPKGSYVVDTSFLLAAAAGFDGSAEPRYKKAFQLKRHLLKHEVGLFYTGVVRNELLHKLRETLFEAALAGSLRRYPNLQKCYRDARKHEALKELIRHGYVKAFEVALGHGGKNLKKSTTPSRLVAPTLKLKG